MNRSFLKLIQQISVATGRAYDGPFAEDLAKHNFASTYWVNSEVLKKTNIMVKTDQIDHGIALSKGTLYNAAQTTDPKKLESLAGKLVPKSAITGRALKLGGDIPVDVSQENSWLTENQIKKLQLTLKPDAKPTTLVLENHTTKMYPIESIKDTEKLKKILSIRHFSISSGIPYRGSALISLIKDTFHKNFTSGIWLTKARIEKIGATLKPDQEPTAFSGELGTELYNADQLEDKSEAEKMFEDIMSYQIVGQSGKNFPKRIADQMLEICKKNPSFDRYWLSKMQARQEGGVLQGETPFPIEDEKGISYFYNVSQMKSMVLDKCIRTHKSYKKAKLDS